MTPQQQAQQCLNRNCLVLDTETTGLDDKAEIIEIAVIDATGKVLLNTLVKPSKPIPAEATSIHGITDEMVKDAPTWPEVNPQLCSLISGKTIAIYNAEYDLRLLEQTDRIWKVTPKISVMPQIVCAMHEYAEFYGQKSDRGGYKWQRLTAAAEQQGVIIEGTPHRALSDCLTTLGVIKAMAAGGYHRASHGITAQKAVDILNGLLQVDHAAITALVNNRVFCSEKLAKETSVDFYDGHYLIGMAGIINALVAPDTIGAIYDDMVLIREARHLFNAHPDQEGYYGVRADFNLRCDSNFIYRAAQFLYLNRHTFNGVCRYNLSGEFNSPFGHRKAPYFPEDEIRAFAEKAQAKKAIFLCCSFPEAIRMAQAGDVIYCDPPYIPASATASFTSYHTDGFTSEQQRKLARMLRIAAKLGRHVVASNSETDAAKALYADFAITSITARRSVSAKAASRADVGEIIATMRASA